MPYLFAYKKLGLGAYAEHGKVAKPLCHEGSLICELIWRTILFCFFENKNQVTLIGTISLGSHDLPPRVGSAVELDLRLDKLLWLGVFGSYWRQFG